MKRILLIGTGGTIASESTEDGLVPALTTRELVRLLPDMGGVCDVDTLQLLSLDSTNITPEHWMLIVRAIRQNYDSYDGFVVTHGTDTLAYTAAAISYMIQKSPKPIVLTGAQKPIGFDSTDSKVNLTDALLCAAGDMPGVSIVFDHKIILGTRAKKTRSKSFSAFSSINYPELGVVRDGGLVRFIEQERAERAEFFEELDTRVALLKLIPGMDRSALDFFFERSDAVIIESFGVGGVPEAGGFYDSIEEWKARGKLAILTTQVENEGSDLAVYRVGYRLKKDLGVLEAYDMTTEAVLAKLMWALGQTRDTARVTELFYTPVAMDMYPVPRP